MIDEVISLNFVWTKNSMFDYINTYGYKFTDENSGGGRLYGPGLRGRSFKSLIEADKYLKKKTMP